MPSKLIGGVLIIFLLVFGSKYIIDGADSVSSNPANESLIWSRVPEINSIVLVGLIASFMVGAITVITRNRY